MVVTGRRWHPLPRLANIVNLWGGRGRFRRIATGRTWALILIRRDDTINPQDSARDPGE